MNDMMKKLIASKPKLSESESKAQLSVLKDLRGQIGSVTTDKLRKLKPDMSKVTVAADSPEGLKEGLNTAEEITSSLPKLENSLHESMPLEAEDAMEEKSPEEMSPEELELKIQELMALKAAKEESSSEELE